MKIAVIIVGHPSRKTNIAKIADALDCPSFVMMDKAGCGATRNHFAALCFAHEHPLSKQGYRFIFMEDDAVPVVGFSEKAASVVSDYPDDLVSFYLGTSRPRGWQNKVDEILQANPDAEKIFLPKLIHGVCYTMPPEKIVTVIDNIDLRRPADFAIGEALGDNEVVYCVRSLVQHSDGLSVESHADGQLRSEKRVARFLASDLFY